MISIFLLYSNDRLNEINLTIECLKDCYNFDKCQKIICCDGSSNFKHKDFQTIEVKRPDSGFYCWAKLWDTGVNYSSFNKIIYLDCDRILPKNFITIFENNIDNKSFVFPKYHFKINKKLNLTKIKNIRDNIKNNLNLLTEDHRVFETINSKEKKISPAWSSIRKKNPMSGCVGFTKEAFIQSGGLDECFQGWGYPDTDFFEKTYRLGFQFKAIEMDELHLNHNINVSKKEFKLMNLWNGIKFCYKWKYPIHDELISLSKEINTPINCVLYYIKHYHLKKFLDDNVHKKDLPFL